MLNRCPVLSPSKAKFLLIGILCVATWNGVATSSGGQGQVSSPTIPSVINSTYVITRSTDHRTTITKTMHVHEENRRLIMDGAWNDEKTSDSIQYDDVVYVKPFAGDSPGSVKTWVGFEAIDGTQVVWEFRTEAEAKAVAEYVASKANRRLELIAGAWRIRKSFKCPQTSYPGCDSFIQLVDHENPEIIAWLYDKDPSSHVDACFSDSEPYFFILYYSSGGTFGAVRQEIYRDEQLDSVNIGYIRWVGGDSGQITRDMFLLKPSQKQKINGQIIRSELSFETKFADKTNSMKKYALIVQLSTGRYEENLSAKDRRGGPSNTISTGLCVMLH